MSIHTSLLTSPNHPRPSLTTAPDMVSHEERPELRLTQSDVHAWNFVVSPPAMHHRLLYSKQHSLPEGGYSHTTHLHPASETFFYPGSMFPSPIGLEQQTQNDYASQWPGDMAIVLESSPISPQPTAANETYGDNISSGFDNGYDSGRRSTYLGGHATCDPHQTLWPDLSDGPPLSRPTENLGHFPVDEPSTRRSFSSTFHVARSRYPSASEITGQSIPFNIPSHRPPGPLLSPWVPSPHPPSDRYVCIVQEDHTPSRHRRGVRAIEYGELWLDEEELCKALIETDGKLTVLRCLWEQDRSPCHLWIRGDKSFINTHIQKWHGGKPGGEKLEVNCHWSSCGKRMRKESITRHILSVHLGELWECRGCGKEIARSDALRRHTANSDSEACRTLRALATYSADARVINVSAALTSGGRLRYAEA